MQVGRVVKLLAGFYYVELSDGKIYECRAKGLFRNTGEKPLVGDMVRILITDEKDMEGSVQEILPRDNELLRPPVANIDRVIIIQSLADPAPRLSLTDKYLIMIEEKKITPIVAFSKSDLLPDNIVKEEILDHYKNTGYEILFYSAKTGEGIEALKDALRDHVTCVAGPSGAGKSSLINALCGDDRMETQSISKKLGRGKQTTRHTELIRLDEDTLILDTPGFGTVDLPDIKREELDEFFPEYRDLKYDCRFAGCSHLSEPDCAVKAAIASDTLSEGRHASYAAFYNELADRRTY